MGSDGLNRLAFKMYLKIGCIEEYRKRHDEIWPELKQLLLASGIKDYSIFLDEETNALFAYQTLSGTNCSQDMRDHPVVQKWWAYMSDLMETNDDLSPVTTSLDEVFRLA